MVSKYFTVKTNHPCFREELNNKLNALKDKKVILYGAGESLQGLLKEFSNFKNLNVVAIADRKFQEEGTFEGFKSIPPEKILEQDFDVVLITLEYTIPIVNYLMNELNLHDYQIEKVFNDDIKDERDSIIALEHYNFKKNLEQITKKLKGKSAILYGAGVFLEVINKYYDIARLNIIAVSDKKYKNHEEGETFLGYKVCSPEEILDIKPDYVFIATKYYIDIVESLYYGLLKNTKIKIKPLMKKPFLDIVKEIWNS